VPLRFLQMIDWEIVGLRRFLEKHKASPVQRRLPATNESLLLNRPRGNNSCCRDSRESKIVKSGRPIRGVLLSVKVGRSPCKRPACRSRLECAGWKRTTHLSRGSDNYHTRHILCRTIGWPGLQPNARWNWGRSETMPLTRYLPGECGLVMAFSRRFSGRLFSQAHYPYPMKNR
jgi:hypothetical protein